MTTSSHLRSLIIIIIGLAPVSSPEGGISGINGNCYYTDAWMLTHKYNIRHSTYDTTIITFRELLIIFNTLLKRLQSTHQRRLKPIMNTVTRTIHGEPYKVSITSYVYWLCTLNTISLLVLKLIYLFICLLGFNGISAPKQLFSARQVLDKIAGSKRYEPAQSKTNCAEVV
jgi:hypothetical protein